MWNPLAGVTCNECTNALRHGRASHPLLVALLRVFGTIYGKIASTGLLRMNAPSAATALVTFFPHTHGRLFVGRGPLLRLSLRKGVTSPRACVHTCVCSSYSQHI
jgi:hypothetical protein